MPPLLSASAGPTTTPAAATGYHLRPRRLLQDAQDSPAKRRKCDPTAGSWQAGSSGWQTAYLPPHLPCSASVSARSASSVRAKSAPPALPSAAAVPPQLFRARQSLERTMVDLAHQLPSIRASMTGQDAEALLSAWQVAFAAYAGQGLPTATSWCAEAVRAEASLVWLCRAVGQRARLSDGLQFNLSLFSGHQAIRQLEAAIEQLDLLVVHSGNRAGDCCCAYASSCWPAAACLLPAQLYLISTRRQLEEGALDVAEACRRVNQVRCHGQEVHQDLRYWGQQGVTAELEAVTPSYAALRAGLEDWRLRKVASACWAGASPRGIQSYVRLLQLLDVGERLDASLARPFVGARARATCHIVQFMRDFPLDGPNPHARAA